MSTWISEQAFSRLQIREKMSIPDGTRTTNLVMACHLMFLYSNYRLIGIAHQQATQPMTEQEANERACLLNGLFNADLCGYDFLWNSETAVDDAIDRYHSDIEFIPQNSVLGRDQKYNVTKVRVFGREMAYNTVHSAKGLEADNIILVNCSQEGNGFPSKVSDDPILGYVLSKPESYPFAEERRLFYVAITRARKHAFVLYKETCPSPFVTEIEKAINGGQVTDNTMVCPWCKNGNLRSIADGVNRNGTKWRVYRCTNNTAGCQYAWVVSFTNEESITRQFKEVKRKSRLYVSADDLDRLKIENPDADCGILPGSGRMPTTTPFTPAPPIPSIAPSVQPPGITDDLPF